MTVEGIRKQACLRPDQANNEKKRPKALLFRVGGPGRGRTADTGIFSAVLYQLSYRAKHSEARLSKSTALR